MPGVEDSRAALADLPYWLDDINSDTTSTKEVRSALQALNNKLEELAMVNNCAAISRLVDETRRTGALERLVTFLDDATSDIHRPALLLLGNLASDKIDPAALTSRHRLRQCSILDKLFPYFESLDVGAAEGRVRAAETAQVTAKAERTVVEADMERSKFGEKQEYLTACERMLEHDALVDKAQQRVEAARTAYEDLVQTLVFMLGVLMNFVTDVKEPMLNASSKLRIRYYPTLVRLAGDDNAQLCHFASHALHQLNVGVALRDKYYATKLQAHARAWFCRSDATSRARRNATNGVCEWLVAAVVAELAAPFLPAALLYAREMNAAATSIQNAMRCKLARKRAHAQQQRRLQLFDAADWIAEEVLEALIADGFSKPMASWHLRESRLSNSLPAAAADAAMRAVAVAEAEACARREARARARHEAAERVAQARAAEERAAAHQRALDMRAREQEMVQQQQQQQAAVRSRQLHAKALTAAGVDQSPPSSKRRQPRRGLRGSRSDSDVGAGRRHRSMVDEVSTPAHAANGGVGNSGGSSSSLPRLPAISPSKAPGASPSMSALQPRTLMLARIDRTTHGVRELQQLHMPAVAAMLEQEHLVFRHGSHNVIIGSPTRLRMMGCDLGEEVDVDLAVLNS